MKKIAIVFLLSIFICPVFVTGQTRKYRSITWEKFQSAGPELKQIGLLAVRHSKDIKSSSWSVGCETLDRDYAKFSLYKDYVGELGVKYGRLQSGWAKCEKQKGVYSFEWLDSCVYGLNEQSVKPWICLCYGNPTYGSDINLGAGVAALAYNEDAMAAWLRYVETTVNRYKSVVNEWEIWNEPYGQEKDYAPVLVRTAELIKKIQPNAVILGEILWNPENPSVKLLLDALKSANKLKLVDYWAYHPYIKNPDDCYPVLDKFITLLKSYNPDYKICQGETGCPSQLEWTHALAFYPWTEYSQAKWDLRRMAGDRVRDIPSSVFTLIDLRYTNMLQSFGLLRANLLNEVIYKRPSFYGVQHMVSFFDDTVKPIGEMDFESNSPRKITVAGFKKKEKPVVLIWYKDKTPSDDLKWDLVDITIKGINFNDPVYVEMITGKVYELDKSTLKNNGENATLKNLPVWDSPIMIAERSQIKLNPDESDLVLFDVTTMSPESISAQFGATYEKKDSIIWIRTQGSNGYPGVLIKGSWNLSKCNRLELELANYDQKGDLPITVRLENPNAIPGEGKGVFIDRVTVPSGGSKKLTISIPPKLPYPEIAEKLFGMRNTPYKLSGQASSLDPGQVSGLAVYINKPNLEWRWGIKRVVAKIGTPGKLPEWMQLSADKFFPFIDLYGQFKHKEWPGKTKSDNELKEAAKKEFVDIEANPGPKDRNQYGGWKNGPKQKATGHFYVKKMDEKWWMIDPEGCLYWSHGVVRVTPSSAVTPLDNREFYFTDLPKDGTPFAEFYTTHDELLYPYYIARGIKKTYDFSASNIYRKYGDNWRGKYADMAHKRLKSWGLNTIANSSDKAICLQDKTPYCDRIELKSPDIEGSNNGWWKFKDPFHPEFRTNFRKQLIERRKELDDPWCLGFFVDNEISWGGPTALAEWTLQSPSSQAAKIEMINRLKKKYGGVNELNKIWKSNYASWNALLDSQEKPSVGSYEDCVEFTAAVTEEYFKNIRDEFKKAAPDKLYMGCRFAGSNEINVRIAAKYCDIISYNIYSHSLSKFRLPEGIDKPVMIGEFHFGALDRGLFHPGLIQTANQQERGEAYKTYVESALRHPNIIGTHWHQFSDQATTGRFDGEDFQVGFTDVCDNPYTETIAKIREVGYHIYEIRNAK